jgi:hypothetical protein
MPWRENPRQIHGEVAEYWIDAEPLWWQEKTARRVGAENHIGGRLKSERLHK